MFKEFCPLIFNQLYEILLSTKEEVDGILEKRQFEGSISNLEQARKAIVGNAFSNLVIYVFIQNKIQGNIKSGVFITNKKSQVRGFEKIGTIYIGEHTQKLDVDLIIYTEKLYGKRRWFCGSMHHSFSKNFFERKSWSNL